MSEIISNEILKEVENYSILKNNQLSIGVIDCFKSNRLTFKKALNIQKCGSYLAFDVFKNKKSLEISKILTSADFCKNRWCLMCASRRSSKILAENISIVKQLQEQSKIRFLLLTLTLSGVKPLNTIKTHIVKLNNSFHKLIKRKEFSNILGYFKSLEFMGDKTQDGYCHPHLHILLCVTPRYFKDNYIKQEKWLEMWREVTGDFNITQVDIKAVKPKNKKVNLNDMDINDILGSFCEVAKYAISPDKLARVAQSKNLIDLDFFTKNARTFSRGGVFKKIKPKLEELNADDWDKIGSFFLRWSGFYYDCEIKNF